MTEVKFWELIEAVFQAPDEYIIEHGFDYTQDEIITEYLVENGMQAILGFHNKLCEKIWQLYLPKIGDLFRLTGYNLKREIQPQIKYISTDGFIDFRAWIVSLGKKDFETFLNFKSEVELFQFDMDGNSAYREDLVFVARRASERLDISIDLEYDLDGDGQELSTKMNWDNLDQKYPRLYQKYQGRF